MMENELRYLKIALLVSLVWVEGEVLSDQKPYDVQPGRFYEISVRGRFSQVDYTNQQAVAVCYVGFQGVDGELPVDDSLVTGFVSGGRTKGYEYLFMDRASRDADAFLWRFQVRTPGGAEHLMLELKPWKNKGEVLLEEPAVQACLSAYDFVGCEDNSVLRRTIRCDEQDDTLCIDGVCCDLSGNPLTGKGVLEARFSPFCASGKTETVVSLIDVNRGGCIRHKFGFRHGCLGGVVEIRAARTNCCRIAGLTLTGMFDARALPSERKPIVCSRAVVEGDVITISGVIDETDAKGECPKSAVASVVFIDGLGQVVKSGQLPASEKFGEYFYLRSGPTAVPFSQKIKVPNDAVRIMVKISRFYNERVLTLRGFRMTSFVPKYSNSLIRELSWKVPKDAILTDPRRVEQSLEQFWGKDGIARVRARSDNPDVRVSPNHGMIIGREYTPPKDACTMAFRDYKGVTMNPAMDWSMNPFTNTTWQLKLLSGYWIPFLGATLGEREYYSHCKAYWQSFMSQLSYPNGYNTIAYNDHTCAARIEAILLTMYGKKSNRETGIGFPSLRTWLDKDELFAKQLLYQLSVDVGLVAYHLRAQTFGLHNHNLIMARSLLQFSDCFRGYEFSRRYRELALRVIFEHLYLMFEPDGFIREQSALYHHSFMQYFSELYQYMRENKSADEKTLETLRDNLLRFAEVDLLFCPPDGLAVPMGDTSANEIRNECKAEISALGFDTEQNPVFAGAFDNLPAVSVFRESGVYVFRNPKKGRFLFVDLSDSLKVHGHRDLGSWQYYSQGVRWISDLGGPYRYGTRQYREFITSSSHTLVEPVGISQSSGVAFAVKLKDCGCSWELSCRSNVYGPSIEHAKKFVIAKDLSTFSVTDAFPGLTGDVRGRLTLAPGCDVTIGKDERTAFLSNGGSSIKVILPKARSHEKLRANASLRTNCMSEMWLLDSFCSGQEPVTYVVRDEK